MRRRGFTLIELLVTIGILGVLSTAVVISLNPAEIFKQSRDTNRFVTMASLNKAIGIFQIGDTNPVSLGSTNIVYISLPDPAAPAGGYDCKNSLGLPALPTGWTYRCVRPADLQKTDGSGWLPINFLGSNQSINLPILPLDPINSYDSAIPSKTYFYTYATNGTGKYELNAKTESIKYGLGN